MAELKTKVHDGDVFDFILNFSNTNQKYLDSLELIKIMEKITDQPPKMWGETMIGFGKYHYKSSRSSQEGDWPLIGFSPRKAKISLYIFTGLEEHEYLLEGLGKFTRGKGCIYINKLSDVNLLTLEQIMLKTIEYLKEKYEVIS
ncbi:DUF1801 domain-containing protein [Acholeplasma granularum]|uniref:DUF1801 domain-containing protein n=1 Tax=Acholeplasma granularum TaxID=264635 RepID=UPI000470EB2D|nr:DUF1801 domain-containing protein [Acholeplasma granularum]